MGQGFRVTFAILPSITVTQPQNTSTAAQAIPATKIENLCVWQRKHSVGQPGCLGFLDNQTWQHRIYRHKKPNTPAADLALLSIQDYVAGTKPGSTSPMVTRGMPPLKKYTLATILASSVLQLSNTPWLGEKLWSLHHVLVMDAKNVSPSFGLLHFPFLALDATYCGSITFAFKDQACTGNTTSGHQNPTNHTPDPMAPISSPHLSVPSASHSHQQPVHPQHPPLIDNPILFHLGVMLIELTFNQPIAALKLPCDQDRHGKDTEYTALYAARRLVEDLEQMEGSKYATVARRCVKCNFDVRDASVLEDNEDLQEQFYGHVVVPLRSLKEELEKA